MRWVLGIKNWDTGVWNFKWRWLTYAISLTVHMTTSKVNQDQSHWSSANQIMRIQWLCFPGIVIASYNLGWFLQVIENLETHETLLLHFRGLESQGKGQLHLTFENFPFDTNAIWILNVWGYLAPLEEDSRKSDPGGVNYPYYLLLLGEVVTKTQGYISNKWPFNVFRIPLASKERQCDWWANSQMKVKKSHGI